MCSYIRVRVYWHNFHYYACYIEVYIPIADQQFALTIYENIYSFRLTTSCNIILQQPVAHHLLANVNGSTVLHAILLSIKPFKIYYSI
jgi:hypothetical protein